MSSGFRLCPRSLPGAWFILSSAICVVTTAALTFFFLGHVRGIGIGTVLAALSMGKVIGLMDKKLSQHFYFATRKMLRQQKQETK